ncbi:thioredoxin domain-containing protein, partial [Candidatus Fermentibacteria bacterium]
MADNANGLNRLSGETSAYLLAHADNPVNWYPWGDEAFAAARAEDKPIFLSIGYSSCHWCHVMEEESFEDPSVAALMNDAFICIKVDREERPDIDNLYMRFTVAMTGGGGWPMTVIMTPEGAPFFAATYIPKNTSFGRTGMMQLIPAVVRQWETGRDEIVAQAAQIETIVIHNRQVSEVSSVPPQGVADSTFSAFRASFDT